MLQTIEHSYPEVDIAEAGERIAQLHDQVCASRRRVHITRPDCADACVMISRAELESLERALSIFADTEAFSGMCQLLSKVLETAGEVCPPQFAEETGPAMCPTALPRAHA